MQITYHPQPSKPRKRGDVRPFTQPQFQFATRQQRVNDALAYMRYAARACARTIVDHDLVLDAIEINLRMATYQVHHVLREHATKLTLEIVEQLKAKRGRR